MTNDSTDNNRNTEDKDYSEKYSVNGKVIFVCLIMFTLAITVRIVQIQYDSDSYILRNIAQNKNFRSVIEPAKRGDIFSDDGKVLATTITLYDIYMDFNAGGMTDKIFNKNVKGLSKGLAKMFRDKSAARYERDLKSYRRKKLSYKKISPRRIDHIELMELNKLPLFNLGSNKGGKIIVKRYIRHNPYENLARRTIGRTDRTVENPKGAMIGLEASFDNFLSGITGVSFQKKISGSFWIPDNSKEFIDPVDGNSIETTINIGIQDVAETAIRKALEKHKADWGTAIVMEVSTGEIKAIANLTRNSKGQIYEDYNYAIGSSMEPGSTFKLMTLMALLDNGASINETVDTGEGRKKVGARYYVDSGEGLGVITLNEIFEKSSNIGFAELTEKHFGNNPAKFISYIRKTGLLNELDLQINGETEPFLRGPKEKFWDKTSLGMLSTGYSAILLNPLRTLMIFNAVANNGKMISPIFVKRIIKDGEVIEEFEAKVLNSKISSKATIKTIKKSLEGVIYDGTGSRILLNNKYKIAGKTGTAQVLVNGTYKGGSGVHYLGSFAGYLPADNPKYSCIVAIKTYKPYSSNKKYYGGTTAGPAFREIADRIYADAIDWGYTIEKPIVDKETREQMENGTYVAPIKSKKKNAIKAIKGDKIKLKRATNFLDIPENDIVFNNNLKIKDLGSYENLKEVPNLVGMGLNDAINIFTPLGVNIISKGKGTIIKQSMPKGAKVIKGSTIYVEMSL